MPPSIQTSNESALGPAPLRYRIAAMIYDALVVMAFWVFTVVILVALTGDVVVGAWLQSLLFVELYAFFTLSWMFRGQTIGMLAWRLELDVQQRRLSAIDALKRFLGALAAFATLGLGYLWMWFDRERRTWPDIFSNTQVRRRPKP